MITSQMNSYCVTDMGLKKRIFLFKKLLLSFLISNHINAQSVQHTTSQNKYSYKQVKEIQLTSDTGGHLLNSTQCFSKDDTWIVYDTRNLETPIPSNGKIGMVNTKTKLVKILYQTSHQSEYGPGVGAATFSPAENRVLFIHGIRNCDEKNPYTFARRTGVSVFTNKPGKGEFLDARNIIPPFTRGALRGGTHAHTWNADGRWVSFTYNDFIIEQLSKKDTSIKDIRVVAVMNNSSSVTVPDTGNPENNNGKMYSAVVTKVADNPAWGSDEIDKAFDEGWIGTNGYLKEDGTRQKRAIAFQGNIKDGQGKTKTEVFVVDIPDDITRASPGCPLEGTTTTRPCVPAGVQQHRITFTDKGIQGPRYWLRTTPDGKWIGFLEADEKGVTQIFIVSPNGGQIRQLTFNDYPVEGPFNFSPDGRQVAYIADNSIFITSLNKGFSERLTSKSPDTRKPVGAVIWSNHGKMLAYNRYLKEKSGNSYLQVFLLSL